ncbi:MAG: cyclic pyranopterin monophosphate synthase MoaC [Clostridia bacterium]
MSLSSKLTHIDENGAARMVDVSDKPVSLREAIASAVVLLQENTVSLIEKGEVKKGDVFSVAIIAGVMAAKKTSEIIPLCHAIPISSVNIDIKITGRNEITITARAVAEYKTGVEMEALTAASVAALTIYDMCKAVDRGIMITNICLLEKSGGASGTFKRDAK